ncbi:MAG: triose-phosphate isomerase, partial [Saprospiraceae bacterium]
MKKRMNIAAGNWKMNKNYEEGRDLALSVVEHLTTNNALVIMATPFIHLKAVSNIINGVSNVKLAAQNCHQAAKGAFTGAISVDMLKSVGVDYVILGHSERREYFNETDELLAEKVNAVLAGDLLPIFCCGESLDIRESGKHVEHVKTQISNSLFHLSAEDFSKIVIAYEPIWAIGTGVTASPEQAQDMHAAIRNLLKEKYGEEVAEGTSILYGGSVKP